MPLPFADFFTEIKIAEYKSKFNPKITVCKFMGQIRIDCGGLTQSGTIIHDIWSHVLHQIIPGKFAPKEILLLGLGGGTLARLLHRKFKHAHITAVEIDPVMIDIAKKYFHADRLTRLSIVNADAAAYPLSANHFDLIFVDCYLGDSIPPKLESIQFIDQLYTRLAPGGFLFINRLYWDKYVQPTQEYARVIGRHFSFLKIIHTSYNLVITIPKDSA